MEKSGNVMNKIVLNPDCKEKAGCLSPEYNVSRPVQLDIRGIADNRCIAILPGSLNIEPYKVLRSRIIEQTKPNGWNTIMITSALPGEGKTLTAINLSLTFAREFNHTVLLIDCDLQKQNIHKMLGISSQKGLIDYLMHDIPVSDIMLWPGVEKFTLISGGQTVQDSSEYLSSPKMKELFQDIKTRYPERYVFFDVPPLLSKSDALAFSPLVDGILFVVESDKTSMDDVEKALEIIPREKFLGFVLNRTKARSGRYSYAQAY